MFEIIGITFACCFAVVMVFWTVFVILWGIKIIKDLMKKGD